jgi:hypothetical protein
MGLSLDQINSRIQAKVSPNVTHLEARVAQMGEAILAVSVSFHICCVNEPIISWILFYFR